MDPVYMSMYIVELLPNPKTIILQDVKRAGSVQLAQ
jgi:hypothetical protein